MSEAQSRNRQGQMSSPLGGGLLGGDEEVPSIARDICRDIKYLSICRSTKYCQFPSGACPSIVDVFSAYW